LRVPRPGDVTWTVTLIGTYVPSGVNQGLNQDLALEVAQRDDFVVGGVHDAIFPGEYLPVKDRRLA
jgi:hypothetical protein